jgi:hypothetical protein
MAVQGGCSSMLQKRKKPYMPIEIFFGFFYNMPLHNDGMVARLHHPTI